MRLSLIALLLCLAVGSLAANEGRAAPSFLGPVGYILTPSADTLGKNNYAMSLHHRARKNLIAVSYSPLDSMEFGVTVLDPTQPGGPKTEIGLNAKLQLLREGDITPTLAVGMWDMFNWSQETTYAVASKNVRLPWPRRPVRVSAGLGNGMYNRGFWALALPVSPSVTGMAEFDGTHFNVGTRMELPRGFTLDVGAVNWELGVGATFGAQW